MGVRKLREGGVGAGRCRAGGAKAKGSLRSLSWVRSGGCKGSRVRTRASSGGGAHCPQLLPFPERLQNFLRPNGHSPTHHPTHPYNTHPHARLHHRCGAHGRQADPCP